MLNPSRLPTASVASSWCTLRDARSLRVFFMRSIVSALRNDSMAASFTVSGTRGAVSISLSICLGQRAESQTRTESKHGV